MKCKIKVYLFMIVVGICFEVGIEKENNNKLKTIKVLWNLSLFSLKDSALEIPKIYANVHNASTWCNNSLLRNFKECFFFLSI